MRYDKFKELLSFIVFSFLVLWKGASFADPSGILIPFYIYPTSTAIQPLLDAKTNYPNVPMRVVMNPDSGVGLLPDPVYVDAIAALQQAGIEVAGYVYTDYNNRLIADVEAEITLWQTWYNPDGIFLDAMGTSTLYYQTLEIFADTLGIGFLVGNPASNVDTGFASIVDTVVLANSDTLPNLNDYANWKSAGLPKTNVGMIVYDISVFPLDWIYQAREFIGWFYVTDQGGMDPWGALPTYFDQLMDVLNTTHPGLLLPFYIYPTATAIQPLLDAKSNYPNVPLRVIMNPNSGPGSSKNTDYVNAIATLQQAGISILGYVHTNYGNRNKTTVKNEINKWNNWYKPDGIFLDEMGLKHAYYQEITAYAKGLGIQYVVGNPGTNIDVSAGNDVDSLVLYEDSSLPTLSTFQNWYNVYSPYHMGFLAYEITPMPNTFISQASQYFGWIYITDDGADGNPWDELATYFSSFVALLETL